MNLPPIDLTANIVQFTGTRREPIEERCLVPVPDSTCKHFRGPFEVDVHAGKCKCLSCGGEVSQIFVLEQLMHEESRWCRARARYHDEMRRLGERSSTKCRHCGKLTRISRV